MSSLGTFSGLPPAMPPAPVRRFTVDEYHRMIEDGYFDDDERYELLDGWVIAKMSRKPPHDGVLDQTEDALRSRLPVGWRLRVQKAITTDDSEPEPDIAVVPGPSQRYRHRHPRPSEIAALFEVAQSSLSQDRKLKGPIYARAKIPVYVIINLIDSIVEVYTDPTGPDPSPHYRSRQDLKLGDVVEFTVAGQTISLPVAELLG